MREKITIFKQQLLKKNMIFFLNFHQIRRVGAGFRVDVNAMLGVGGDVEYGG